MQMVRGFVGSAKRVAIPFWHWESQIGRNLLVLLVTQARTTTLLAGQFVRLPLRTTRLVWTHLGWLPSHDAPGETVPEDGDGPETDEARWAQDEPQLEAETVAEPAETDNAETDNAGADHAGVTDGEVAVTFRLPASVDAHTVHLSGEFNEWSTAADTMNRRDDGSFELIKVLPAGRRWRFRYLLDGSRWENDWQADDYAANALGDYDSVVDLQAPSASRLVAGREPANQ